MRLVCVSLWFVYLFEYEPCSMGSASGLKNVLNISRNILRQIFLVLILVRDRRVLRWYRTVLSITCQSKTSVIPSIIPFLFISNPFDPKLNRQPPWKSGKIRCYSVLFDLAALLDFVILALSIFCFFSLSLSQTSRSTEVLCLFLGDVHFLINCLHYIHYKIKRQLILQRQTSVAEQNQTGPFHLDFGQGFKTS